MEICRRPRGGARPIVWMRWGRGRCGRRTSRRRSARAAAAPAAGRVGLPEQEVASPRPCRSKLPGSSGARCRLFSRRTVLSRRRTTSRSWRGPRVPSWSSSRRGDAAEEGRSHVAHRRDGAPRPGRDREGGAPRRDPRARARQGGLRGARSSARKSTTRRWRSSSRPKRSSWARRSSSSTPRSPRRSTVSSSSVSSSSRTDVTPNEQLFRFSEFDPLLCKIQVPEKELSRLRKGQTAYLERRGVAGTSVSKRECFASARSSTSPRERFG